jgi:hypothetical protein
MLQLNIINIKTVSEQIFQGKQSAAFGFYLFPMLSVSQTKFAWMKTKRINKTPEQGQTLVM